MKFRRIVTGHNREGKSVIERAGEMETVSGRPGFSQIPVWATQELPARLTGEDPSTWKFGTTIAGGSVFRVIEYAPGVAERWHRTDSIDYAVVLSGEIDMQMDEGETRLKAGDVIVQRGTMHNWVNRGTVPCVIAFVLIATQGGKATGW